MAYPRSSDVVNNDCNGCNCLSSPLKKQKNSLATKIFCDPVHGQIALHPACVTVIDTPQFQRLRSIKQTGFLEYVFPGATHNRFSHSLGVCYLAGKFLQELREHQPELVITETDILCVQLAGLCHDLGHGPFSHTWELFMKSVNSQKNGYRVWKHEIVSINMFDYLIEENNLAPFLKNYGIGSTELNLIKDFIQGNQPQSGSKAFLYQIVNNEDSGLDVDKWDYFLRDCHYLGLPCNFEYERLIQFAKVIIINGRTEICFRDKILESVYNVFRTRSNLHRLAYQHKIVMILERMFLDAVVSADGKCVGPSGEVLQFSEWSMSAAFSHGETLRKALAHFSMLVDEVILSCIRYSSDPRLAKANAIIKALERRSQKTNGIYQHVGLKILPYMVTEVEIQKGFCQLLSAGNERILSTFLGPNFHEKDYDPVTEEDICICVVPINWGKGDKNPVDFVHFYCKNDVFSNASNCHDVSAMLPKCFQEIQVHVLCRRSDNFAIQVSQWCFENFWTYSPTKKE